MSGNYVQWYLCRFKLDNGHRFRDTAASFTMGSHMTRLILCLVAAIAFSAPAFAFERHLDGNSGFRNRYQYENDMAARDRRETMLEDRLRAERNDMGARLDYFRHGYQCGLFGCDDDE